MALTPPALAPTRAFFACLLPCRSPVTLPLLAPPRPSSPPSTQRLAPAPTAPAMARPGQLRPAPALRPPPSLPRPPARPRRSPNDRRAPRRPNRSRPMRREWRRRHAERAGWHRGPIDCLLGEGRGLRARRGGRSLRSRAALSRLARRHRPRHRHAARAAPPIPVRRARGRGRPLAGGATAHGGPLPRGPRRVRGRPGNAPAPRAHGRAPPAARRPPAHGPRRLPGRR